MPMISMVYTNAAPPKINPYGSVGHDTRGAGVGSERDGVKERGQASEEVML